MSGQLALALGEADTKAAALWQMLPPEARADVILRLARLLAALIAAGHDD